MYPPPLAQWEWQQTEERYRERIHSLLYNVCNSRVFFSLFFKSPVGTVVTFSEPLKQFFSSSFPWFPLSASVPQLLPGLHRFAVHEQHSRQAPGFKYWVGTYHVAEKGRDCGELLHPLLCYKMEEALHLWPLPSFLHLPPIDCIPLIHECCNDSEPYNTF